LNRTGKYQAIVIGTSAGGLFALSNILTILPPDYPIPVIIAQHRSKDQPHLLEEVLQSKCRIRIKQADEKEKVESAFVYIAPPDYHLLIEEDRTFSLSCDPPVNHSRPSIDVLFETAALAFGKTLIGIILTGANGDGARGIATIKKMGGITIAQDPADAQFPVMPEAAIATNQIVYIRTLEEIGSFLLKIANSNNENN
jgi:two-component system chemotaxis response regulator CheB